MFPKANGDQEETLMSRGPGRVQQTITDLIASDPHGAWTVREICERLYPGWRVEKKHRVAVTRALRRMKLPGTWGVRMLHRQGSEYYLYDKCDEESTEHADYLGYWKAAPMGFAAWKERFPHRIDEARKSCSEARRYRDASPIEKLQIEIAELNTKIGFAGMAGISPAPFRQQIAELKEKKTELQKAT
jgi:hypothetical protein